MALRFSMGFLMSMGSDATNQSTLPDNQRALASRVRELREGRELSQARAGELLGMKLTAYQALEYGRASISFTMGVKLCQLYNVNERYLATGKLPKRPYLQTATKELPPESQKRSMDYLTGYKKYLAARVDDLLGKLEHQRNQIRAHLADLPDELRDEAVSALISTYEEIEAQLAWYIKRLGKAEGAAYKLNELQRLMELSQDYQTRLKREQ